MKTIEDRFWSKVDIKGEDDCWNWKRNGFRYGSFIIGNKTHRAHRIAWKLFNKKEIPEGFYVLHRCDNTLCVNPKHLYLGTQQDNMNDMKRKGRQSRLFGERGGRCKLTSLQVEEMRALHKTGKYSKAELARRFNIGWSQTQRIVRYEQRNFG